MPLAPTNLEPIDPVTNPQGHLNIWHQRGNTLVRNLSLLHLKVSCKYFLALEAPTVNGRELVIASSARPEDFLEYFTGEITEAAFKCANDITPHAEIMARLDRIERAADNQVVHPNLLQKRKDATAAAPSDPNSVLVAAMRNLASVSDACRAVSPTPSSLDDDIDLARSFREDTQHDRVADNVRHLVERNDHSMTPRAWLEHFAANDTTSGTEAEPNRLDYLYPDRRLHRALYPKAKGVEPLLYSKLSLGADGSAFKILQKAKQTGGNISDILREKHQARRTIKKKRAHKALAERVRHRISEKQQRRRARPLAEAIV